MEGFTLEGRIAVVTVRLVVVVEHDEAYGVVRTGPIGESQRAFRALQADFVTACKFAFEGDGRGDPFDSLELERLVTGSPILRRAARCWKA